MPYRFKKWCNARRNRSELRRGSLVLNSFPREIFIDPTNICNFRCPLCPTGQRKIPPPHGFMEMEVFQKVVSTLGPWAQKIHLYNWGEPLLHPDIVEMARLAARFGAKTYISTNLSTLKPGMAEGLVKSGLDLLNASIDGVTQESYGAYREGGDLGKVLANLRELAKARGRSPKSRLRIRWQFMANRRNESEIDEARRLAGKMGVEFRVKRIALGLEDFDKQSATNLAENDDVWLPQDVRLNRYKRRKRSNLCRRLWEQTVVNFDGSINPCCQIFKPEHNFADRFDQDFHKIWNGPIYQAARRLFLAQEADPKADQLVCAQCMRFGNIR